MVSTIVGIVITQLVVAFGAWQSIRLKSHSRIIKAIAESNTEAFARIEAHSDRLALSIEACEGKCDDLAHENVRLSGEVRRLESELAAVLNS